MLCGRAAPRAEVPAMPRSTLPLLLSSLLITACGEPPAAPAAPAIQTEPVSAIADAYYAAYLLRFPTAPYFAGLPTDHHDRLMDNSPEALAAWWAREDALYQSLLRVDRSVLIGTPDWVTHGLLQEELEASIGLRICRNDLWDVNHMWGWQLALPRVAAMQPVDDDALRTQAQARWRSMPAFIDQQVANLRTGLAAGYSAPKAVVRRVIDQVNGLIALDLDASPFMDPARRAEDPEFTVALAAIVSDGIAPALLRYRDFLLDE
jgi:uncharacterized protein (DUF885 family)